MPLGRTGIGGYILGDYKEHKTIINGLCKLMPDGGSAFELLPTFISFSTCFVFIISKGTFLEPLAK
jgi:hypothetical protein